jgi:hypothetical protein
VLVNGLVLLPLASLQTSVPLALLLQTWNTSVAIAVPGKATAGANKPSAMDNEMISFFITLYLVEHERYYYFGTYGNP